MRKIAVAAIAAVALAGCAADPAADERAMTARADGEALLASELRGFEQSGPAISCVNRRMLQGSRSAGEDAIIFRTAGNRLYVNHPPAGCPRSDNGRALVIRSSGSQLCSGEIASVIDPVSGMEYGSCGLGDFTPYRRRPA